ncbi:MAG: hypothetical protein NWE95_06520 [Candidatus Bathyarchaeota archaeon]|nr:hypothetical protein [Candidatus Bathyarchaeota archaeon]
MYLKAIASTLNSRRFWIWQISGAIIYAIPATIRIATGDSVLPFLSLFATPWIGHYVPANLVEKILVNAFFPGGAGAIAGEVFYTNKYGEPVTRKKKYLARLGGAMLWVTAWTLFQYWGNAQNIISTYGGNLFEYPSIYPLNFGLAALSVFTPDVVGFVKNKTAKAYHRLRRNKEC